VEGAPVLILCHLDTVHAVGAFGDAPVRIDGSRLTGPGALDMKGGVALALEAARALAASPEGARPVRLLITSDEEVGSPTSRALIEAEGAAASHVLVTEPARANGGCVTGPPRRRTLPSPGPRPPLPFRPRPRRRAQRHPRPRRRDPDAGGR
jgi:glutamate carboxypeptidase